MKFVKKCGLVGRDTSNGGCAHNTYGLCNYGCPDTLVIATVQPWEEDFHECEFTHEILPMVLSWFEKNRDKVIVCTTDKKKGRNSNNCYRYSTSNFQ